MSKTPENNQNKQVITQTGKPQQISASGQTTQSIKDTLPKQWKRKISSLSTEAGGITEKELQLALNIFNDLDWECLKKDDEFYRVLCETLRDSLKWWIDWGRNNLNNKEFNSTLYKVFMRNVWNWEISDKVGVDREGGVQIVVNVNNNPAPGNKAELLKLGYSTAAVANLDGKD